MDSGLNTNIEALGDEKDERLLVTESLSKTFGPVQALKNVDFTLKRGEVHALVGENGAGKSTLAKILAGTIMADQGCILLDGHQINFTSPRDAIASGVAEVYQAPMVVRTLPIWVNIFLGQENCQRGLLSIKAMIDESKKLLAVMGCNLNPNRRVSTLSQAEIQIVAIAKALHGKVKVLILDEPTASLTSTDTERLFKIINRLKNNGVGIIYISHRLREIPAIADQVTVLRDGRLIATSSAKTINENELIKLMTGKEVVQKKSASSKHNLGDVLLSCRNLVSKDFEDVSFDLKQGDIIGIGGLVGSGKEEINRTIFGLCKRISGRIEVGGEEITPYPGGMLNRGVMYFPPDRHLLGLVLNHNLSTNVTLSSLPFFLNSLRLLNSRQMLDASKRIIDTLDIRPKDAKRAVKTFSGGNQQKIMIGRALTRPVKILLFDEPTHGVDVGARERIYEFIRRMAEDGAAVVVVTSDMQELLSLPKRIAVMSRGICSPVMDADDIDEEKVLALSFAGHRMARNNRPEACGSDGPTDSAPN